MKAAQIIGSVAIAVVLASPAALASPQKNAPQQSIAVDKLPAAVTAAVEKAYPKSTIVSAATVSRGKQVRYELSVKPSGASQPIAVMASADGQIRAAGGGGKGQGRATPAAPAAQGEVVAIDRLPKVVVQAIKDAYPKDSITGATRIAVNSQILYELLLSDVSSLMPMRVVVSSDGKIQKR